MRILKGTLLETRYSVLINSQSPLKPGPLEVISSKTYSEGQVTYMSDNLGVHRISNQDPNNVAVSLHRKSLRVWYVETELMGTSLYATECGS